MRGSRLCDTWGCAFGTCLPLAGEVFQEFAPAWVHGCGMEHDTSQQNWRCDSVPPRQHGCACVSRTVRLPAGSYRLTITAGFPPIATPMTVRVLQGSTLVASSTFNVEGLRFSQHSLEFQAPPCAELTFVVERSPRTVEFVINQIVLFRF